MRLKIVESAIFIRLAPKTEQSPSTKLAAVSAISYDILATYEANPLSE
jgi:hypothetical protein